MPSSRMNLSTSIIYGMMRLPINWILSNVCAIAAISWAQTSVSPIPAAATPHPKSEMTDPLSGEEVDVLWVKGSGGDLRTSTRANFASLYMDKFLSLENIYNKAEVKGVKTEIEDAMVDMYRHTTFGLNPAASSIDTPLHGLIPYRHVDHMHPISVIAIAASKDQERLTQESI